MDEPSVPTEAIAQPREERAPGAGYLPGDRVAERYRLLKPLGSGGFSEVFLAFDDRLSREVAVKILHSPPSQGLPVLTDQQASRFLREARMIARMDHPHIVPVYDAGVENGVPWIAMKRVLGEALDSRLKAGALASGHAVRLLSQIAGALRHAHQRGIAHLDLKPANFLLEAREDGSDHVWLTDFGIAILRNEVRPEGRLKGNRIVGTPGYMAPEQINGGFVDERADLFTLGCIAAELVTGRPVFSGPSAKEVCEAVLRGDADLGGIDERAGRRYADAVRRCLASSPEKRWRTVEAFAQALAQADPEASPSLLSRLRRRSRPAPSWDGRFAIRVEGLTKGYRFRRPVIENLDLAIPRGAIYTLLGRNGAGKTTLLRTILGLYRRDRGRVEMLGKDPERDGPAVLARVGWVPDQLYFEEGMRVRELLDFVRRAYPTWDQPYCYRLLARFELPLESRLRDLSRGMKTKVALVMSLAHRPELILLDDATLGLDAVILDELVEALAEANRQDGSTILLASHNYEETERIATHIGFLHGGSLMLSAPLDELKQRIREAQVSDNPWAALQNPALVSRLRQLTSSGNKTRELSLREIFVRLLR